MPLNLGRWIDYAKAKVESAVSRGNDELTRREAEREVELADKPWLAADAESPTLEEARARIEYESRRQQDLADERDRAAADRPAAPNPSASGAPTDGGHGSESSPTSAAGGPTTGAPTPPVDPEALRLAAEAEQAKLAIEARDRAAAARLDEIRRELGVDAPPPDGSST
ncbi:MAG: hypothetical protein KF703_07555 [Actinobacteria bacterium]|nr:hypothetical protein [Actinomycetota bacterium]